MNIMDAARGAFPQGKGIGHPLFPGVTIQEDEASGFLVAVTDDGEAHGGWNPTAEQLMDEGWAIKERTTIKRRGYPLDHF